MRKTTRSLIFNLRFQLKKQNKSNINKYSKQCTNKKRCNNSFKNEKELLVKRKLERLKLTNEKQKGRLRN